MTGSLVPRPLDGPWSGIHTLPGSSLQPGTVSQNIVGNREHRLLQNPRDLYHDSPTGAIQKLHTASPFATETLSIVESVSQLLVGRAVCTTSWNC